jgi:uncharacterized protein (DUF433 family)
VSEAQILERIVVSPDVMSGKPVIRGTRLAVSFVLGLLAAGQTPDDILKEYPGITIHDLHACLAFAKRSLDDSAFVPLAVKSA